jgi:hypothetical protein
MRFIAENKDFFVAVASIIASISFLVAAGTFCLGLRQYRVNQRWKRNEFLAEKIDAFFSDQDVIDVEGMLDYNGKGFQIKTDGIKKTVYVYHSSESLPVNTPTEYHVDLSSALKYHTEGSQSQEDIEIRQRFDAYLDYIGRFAVFIQNGLFRKEDIFPYLEYHVSLLNGLRDHSAGYHKALYNYAVLYGFDRAVQFLGQFKRAEFVRGYVRQAQKLKRTLAKLPLSEERTAEYRNRILRSANTGVSSK